MRIFYLILLLVMTFFADAPAKTALGMLSCEADQFNKNKLRETFFEASYNKEAFLRLDKCLHRQSFLDSVDYHGYEGAFKVLRARYEGGIFKKLIFVSNGTDMLDKAINEAPENIELRFLRFATVYHLPAIIQNKKELRKDKRYIIHHVQQANQLDLSELFTQKLLDFMKETGCFSKSELSQFRKEIKTYG